MGEIVLGTPGIVTLMVMIVAIAAFFYQLGASTERNNR